MTTVPSRVVELVETFDRNIDTYRSQQYNETQLRREFIDPFFEQLGWDVANKAGYAQAYKDVIHEDAIKISGETKAPDYCFRIGGTRKFFLEAKKPSVNIKGDPHPAYQLRRYAWSAKLPLSILTDFEEFAVYDCLSRPKQTDTAGTARITYLTYNQYLDNWSEIADIFSRDAVLKGSFDKFAVSAKGKRGTTTVDVAFLAEIEKWRDMLAKIIALRNRSLSTAEINFAVQRTIDRILFLRLCEDRGIEPYGQLRSISSGDRNYPRLCEIFEKADQKYNSGLFHFEDEPGRPTPPDRLTPNIIIDDTKLKWILHNLYYPLCPYEFSVLPAEILGNVYEQFLGNIIEVTPGRRTTVVPKPEVKKAGGVYYTPSYIVDYIVKNTIGKLIESKTPRQIANIKILDPACGSGSFLLGAFTHLLNYHRDWYVENNPSKHRNKIYQGRAGQWFLTIAEKKKNLLNNIFGVDIDSQAVEVTKLSLLLKVLEGENSQSLENQHRLFHERALPDLANNIKCGNSLIGSDFFDTIDPDQITDDLRNKINPFDWQQEFPEIFSGKNPGFDAVIGNPPWGGDIDEELEYFHRIYPRAVQRTTDSFKLFTSKTLDLAACNGYVSMIVPQPLLRQKRYTDIRSLMLEFALIAIVDLGENVFPRVVAPSCIFVVQKRAPENQLSLEFWNLTECSDNLEKSTALNEKQAVPTLAHQSDFLNSPDHAFLVQHPQTKGIWPQLGGLDNLTCKDAGINYQRVGVGMAAKGKSDLGKRLLYEGPREKRSHVMFWKGTDIARYWIADKTNRFCRPECKKTLRPNEVVRLATNVYAHVPKILLRQTADRILACIDYNGVWFGRSILSILPKPQDPHRLEYFLGLLNSKYLDRLYQSIAVEKGRVFAQVKFAKLKQLPILTIDFDNPDDKAIHDRMVTLVERMLDLHKKLNAAKVPDEKTKIQRHINTTDKKIDNLVYELYDLTKEEIAIVEGKK